uniref:ubiquitin carboxyl-terminal hydrolase 13-like isoform X2 n=1 Tax=Fragaria vesca subsp. vesca TaxID=101020 RepID=UPI0005C9B908|nr:PREDICTED: ubiquitin carboxyl-terminal hydrolase 13-like isoform X2 [Fragaria vesca subsp. vesca]
MSLADHQPAIVRVKTEERVEPEQDLDAPSGTFTWKIKKFSNLKTGKYVSDSFIIGGTKWRLYMYLTGDDKHQGKHLALYLGVAYAQHLAPGRNIYAHFRLTVVNQLDINKSVTKPRKGIQREFDADKNDWGFKAFMPLSELYECSAGYVLNDVCIVEAKVYVPLRFEHQGSNVSVTMESSRNEHKRLEQNVNPMKSPATSAATKAANLDSDLPTSTKSWSP